MYLSSKWPSVLLAILACSVGGCSLAGDAESQADAAEPGVAGPNATLSFEQSGTLTLAPGEIVSVGIVGSPAAHYDVSFFLIGNALDATLDRTTTTADEAGRASVLLRAPNSATTFHVRAVIKDGPSAELTVAVSDKGFGVVEVMPVYAGQRDVTTWVASVVARTTCADIAATLPADPEGAIVATSASTQHPLVSDAPVGPNLAVTLRAGHYLWGCADSNELVAGGTTSVKVTVIDKPIDLAATHLAIDLAFSPEPDPFAAIVDEAASTLVGAMFPEGAWAWSSLLDAMGEALPTDDFEAFLAVRDSAEWDDVASYHFDAGSIDLPGLITGWIGAGLAAQNDDITGNLDAIGNQPGHALLGVTSFSGLNPKLVGLPDSHLMSWSADANDNVLLSGSLFWLPTRYVGALALDGAQQGSPAIATVPEALGQQVDCAGLSVSLGGFATCDEACLLQACEDALAALWETGISASAELGDVGEVSITAGGRAKIGDTANPVSFAGDWLGKVKAGGLVATVSGSATGAAHSGSPE